MAEYAQGISIKERAGQFGPFLSVGVQVETFVAWLTSQPVNERGYLDLAISPRKETGKYGETHSAKLLPFRPKAEPFRPAGRPAPQPRVVPDDDDPIPF